MTTYVRINLLTGAFLHREFSGMIPVITSNVIIPATPSNPSIPCVIAMGLASTRHPFLERASPGGDRLKLSPRTRLIAYIYIYTGWWLIVVISDQYLI